MPATLVTTLSFFRHPKTGRRVPPSQEKSFRAWFKKRYKGRRPKKENWLYTVDGKPSVKRQGLKIGDQYHRIQLQYKMTEVEKILPLTGFTDRHIRDTFNKEEVFRNIWQNWGGIIRIKVSGTVEDGRRVREVIHLGYHKEHWELQTYQHGGKTRISGRERFRRWLVSAVSTNLRRRGLRLSSPKESQNRIFKLHNELTALQGMTEYMKPSEMPGHVNQIKWKAEAIQKQRKTKQLRGATLRIDKLV